MIIKVCQFCSIQVAEDGKVSWFADIAINIEGICDFIQDFAVVSNTKWASYEAINHDRSQR